MENRNVTNYFFYRIFYGSFKNLSFRAFFLLGCLAFLVIAVKADVAVDASNVGGAFSQTGVPSFSWTHTVTTGGNNRVLYVGVSTTSDAASSTVLNSLCSGIPIFCSTTVPIPITAVNRVVSVTFANAAMERVGSQTSPDFQYVVELFRLVNPPAGNNPMTNAPYSVEVDLIDGLATNAVGGSISFTGADEPAAQTFYSNSGFNSNPGLSVSGATNRSGIALGVVATSPNAIFIGDGSGQIEQWNGRAFFSNSYDVGKGSTKPAGASAVFSWILTNTNVSWATGGVFVPSFIPSASPASISGRARTVFDEPLKNVLVTLQNLQTGEAFNTATDDKGFYYFEGLEPARLYQIKVFSNFYNFSPNARILNLTESLEEINFYGSPRKRKERFFK